MEKHHGKVKKNKQKKTTTKQQQQQRKKSQSFYEEKENDNIELMHDPYAVALKMKSKGKLIDKTDDICQKNAQVVFPRMRSNDFWEVLEEKYWPLPIPKGGLEIILEVELKIED